MGRLVRACVCKHLYIRVVQAAIFLELHPAIYSHSHNHPSKVSYQFQLMKCVCMYLYIIIMCSAQPEVAAVLDWYGPEADPAYWQRGREEVAGLQVVCEAHNLHVGGKFLGHRPEF